jgi:hypothetical protein
VAAGTGAAFGVVVQPQTHARKITSAAKSNEYRANLMMFNIKITLIFVTIPIRKLLRFFMSPEIRYAAMREKLLCPPAPTLLYAHVLASHNYSRGVL